MRKIRRVREERREKEASYVQRGREPPESRGEK